MKNNLVVEKELYQQVHNSGVWTNENKKSHDIIKKT
jgi:hypothetical protein